MKEIANQTIRSIDSASVKELCNLRKPPALAVTVMSILSHVLQLKPDKKGVYPNYEYDFWAPVIKHIREKGLTKDLTYYDFSAIKSNKPVTEVLKLV